MPVNYTGGGRNRNVLHTSKRQIDATGTPSLQARRLKRRNSSTTPYGPHRKPSFSRITKSRLEQTNGRATDLASQFEFAFVPRGTVEQSEVGSSNREQVCSSNSTAEKAYNTTSIPPSPARRKLVHLRNPATSDLSALRQTLLAHHNWAQLGPTRGSEPSETKTSPSTSSARTTLMESSDHDSYDDLSPRESPGREVIPSNPSWSRHSQMQTGDESDGSSQTSAAATLLPDDTSSSMEILEFSSEADMARQSSLLFVEQKSRTGIDKTLTEMMSNDPENDVARPESILHDLNADFAASANSFYRATLQAFGLSPPRIQYNSLMRATNNTARLGSARLH